MLAIPDTTAHVTKRADWVELSCLCSPDGRAGFGTLISASDLTIEEQEPDIGEEDALQDDLVVSVQAELADRKKYMGADYPFAVDDNGDYIEIVAQPTPAGYVYLFCLFLSHGSDHSIIPEALAPDIDKEARDLFQACATVAAGGFVQGYAFSFGWQRPDKTQFLQALHKIYKLFGDGTPCTEPPPAAPEDVKDDGIDIIAWQPSPDGLPGTAVYLLAQVASGQNWLEKSVMSDSLRFHHAWFTKQPVTKHKDAMFMPFCVEPKDNTDRWSSQEIAVAHMQRLMSKYGEIIYRYRLPYYVSRGLEIHAAHNDRIEGVSDLPRVAAKVRKYSDTLKAAITS